MTPTGESTLRIDRNKKDPRSIDLVSATWIGLVNVEGFMPTADNEGWWVIGHADGAVALRENIGMLDAHLRTGVLSQACERIPAKMIIDLASTPNMFIRGLLDGVLFLDRAQSERLRAKESITRVKSVRDFPTYL